MRTDTHHLAHDQIRFFKPANDYTYDNEKEKKYRKEVDTYKERYVDHSLINIFSINSCFNNTHAVNNEQRKVDST